MEHATKVHYKYIVLVVLYATTITAATCPDTCNNGEVCNDADGGCADCKEGWFGRHCEHALECYIGYGYTYKGTANITVNNIACQHWSSQTPHKHGQHSLRDEMNYCRNPNPASGDRVPWCYQMEGDRSGQCIVSKCDTQCPVPTLYPFGDIINPPSSGFAVGVTIEVITGACGPGKRGFMTCQKDKTWSTANCIGQEMLTLPEDTISPPTEIKCPSPSLETHSSISPPQSVFKYRDIIRIVCDIGYTLQGTNTTTCQADNTWSSMSYTCTKNECPYPNINPNSKIEISKSVFQYGDVITFHCDHGYEIQGPSQLTCQANKTWNMESPICKIVQCMAPNLPNTTRIANAKDTYLYGDVITLSCTEGHNLVHGNTSVCQATAEWSEPFPVCSEVECGKLKLTSHLVISNPVKNIYTYKDTISFSCDKGYVLSHDIVLACQANKEWNNTLLPICVHVADEVLTTAQWIGTTVGVALVCILISVAMAVFFMSRFKGVEKKNATPSSSTVICENKTFDYDEIDSKTKDQSNMYNVLSE